LISKWKYNKKELPISTYSVYWGNSEASL